MRTDADLQADLMERLDAIPALGHSEIQVDVDHGRVTLSGEVDTPQTRFQIERAAKRVAGMQGLEIRVRPGKSASRKHH
jgi:osmotically-inducible protein OsmY